MARQLIDLSYDERRMLVVMKPQAVTGDGGKVGSSALTVLPVLFGMSVLGPLAGILAPAVVKAVDSFRSRAKADGFGGEMLIITPEEARSLAFPVSHPQKKVVYIGHPLDPPVYVPFAQFHSFLFQHKVAEALRLVRTLGAETVTIDRTAGWKQTTGVHIDVPAPSMNLGAKAGRHRESESSVQTKMTLNPTRDPYLPDHLVWLSHEPLWQEVAAARLEAGLTSFEIQVRSSEDYGVNAGLKAMVEKSGLDIGGEFIKHEATVWELKGTFAKPTL